MSDIFVSYASEDRDRVSLLVQALEKKGWKIFWDTTIPGGTRWRQTIEAEIQGCRCVLVVWTQKSVNSQWVTGEAVIGQKKNNSFLSC
jgi:TIR domain